MKKKIKFLKEFYDNGFNPLFPQYLENDNAKHEVFAKRKKEKLSKQIKKNLSKTSTEFDIDGDLLEEYDDDLIADDEFASFLNDNKEIIVNDTLYKYTNVGLFSVHSSKKSILDEYINNNVIDNLNQDFDLIQRGEIKINDDINLIIPTKIKINSISSCDDSFGSIDDNVLVFLSDSCEDDNYPINTSLKTPTDPMINYLENLSPCNADTAAFHLWGLFEKSQKCYENFSDSRFRTKTKFRRENYIIYKSIGVKVKHQKKGWTGFWRAKKTDEILLSIDQATFEFSNPITLPSNYFQPKFYFFEDKIFNSQSQIINYYNNTLKPPKPELPWNVEVILVEWINNENLTTTMVRDLFYQGAWFGAKLLVNNYKMKDPNSFAHIIYNNNRVFVNYIDLSQRELDSKKIVNVFDFNFQIGIKFNVNIDRSGNLTTNLDSFGDVINSITIPRVYDYSNIKIDFAGLSKRGNEWRGSKISFSE